MKKAVANAIYEAAQDEGLESIRLRKNYSGRYMYGDSCYAITGSEYEYHKAVALAAYSMVENAPYNSTDFDGAVENSKHVDMVNTSDVYDLFSQTAEQVDVFLVAALNARTDNMGLDYVWY